MSSNSLFSLVILDNFFNSGLSAYDKNFSGLGGGKTLSPIIILTFF
jgi:hypothetical protein